MSKLTKKCMAIRTLSNTASGWPYISLLTWMFLNRCISVSTGLINAKLGAFVTLDEWLLMSLWICGSIVANPIIYRLIPSPSWFEIRQWEGSASRPGGWEGEDRNTSSDFIVVGGAVASWLVCSTPERAVQVQALAGDIVLCSLGRHFTFTMPLSTQVYKWVPADCWGNLTNCGEVTCNGRASHPGEVEILLAASCYRNRDKLQQLWASLGSKASHTHTSLL